MPETTRTVGRYELIDVVGRGGAAIVYRARQTDLGRDVALKRLVDLHGNTDLVQRFLREAQLAGGLAHPNIVPVYEYLEHEGDAYIAMELLPHGSLRAYVGHLSFDQIGGVLEGILSALAYAADRLVHRDVKPENVLVAADGRVKLADFGVARAIGAAAHASLTTADGIIGSTAYMAPEQASGGAIGPWTDLFATGVVAYELLVGERPYPPGGSATEGLAQLVSAPIRPPRQVKPDLDRGLAAWLEQMLRRDPADRIHSASLAWDELEGHLIRLRGERWRRASAIDVQDVVPEPAEAASPALARSTAAAGSRPKRLIPEQLANRLPIRSRSRWPSPPPRWCCSPARRYGWPSLPPGWRWLPRSRVPARQPPPNHAPRGLLRISSRTCVTSRSWSRWSSPSPSPFW